MSFGNFAFFDEFRSKILLLESQRYLLILEDDGDEEEPVNPEDINPGESKSSFGQRSKPSRNPVNRRKKTNEPEQPASDEEEVPPVEGEETGSQEGAPAEGGEEKPEGKQENTRIRPKGIKPSVLLRNTPLIGRGERIYKAIHEVRTRPPIVTETKDGFDKVAYNFKAFPSTEFKRHWGYMVYDPRTKLMIRCYCDCADFNYRIYAPLVKKGLASWDQPKPFDKRMIHPNNHAWTNATNPQGTLFFCKHLTALALHYLP